MMNNYIKASRTRGGDRSQSLAGSSIKGNLLNSNVTLFSHLRA